MSKSTPFDSRLDEKNIAAQESRAWASYIWILCICSIWARASAWGQKITPAVHFLLGIKANDSIWLAFFASPINQRRGADRQSASQPLRQSDSQTVRQSDCQTVRRTEKQRGGYSANTRGFGFDKLQSGRLFTFDSCLLINGNNNNNNNNKCINYWVYLN